MSTDYQVYEDDQIEITTTEQSGCFDLTICLKGKAQFPRAVLEFFNDQSMDAKTLGEMGFNILYAATLQMDDADIRNLKERVAKL